MEGGAGSSVSAPLQSCCTLHSAVQGNADDCVRRGVGSGQGAEAGKACPTLHHRADAAQDAGKISEAKVHLQML